MGRKLFSYYGTVPDNREWTQIQTSVASAGDKGIPSPPLLFRPPENIGADFKAQSNKEISEWLAQNEPSRTTRLIKVAQALDQASSDAASFIAEFKKQYPGDPGADLAVISFAMTPLEPRMPDALLGVIDQSAESLFKTFNDPFMLFVRGLVHEAKGDQAGSDKFMQQSNQAGFVSVRMLREPFEQAVQRGDKEATLAALKQIGDYWSTKAELDKSSNAEGLFGQVWTTAKNKSDALKSQLAKRDGDSGGISNFNPGNNSQASPFGRALPQGLQAGLPRTGRDPNPMPNPTPDTMRREPGFAGPQRPGGQPGPGFPGGAPGGIPGGFPPPPEPSSANVRFVLDAKTKLDANAILEKLKDKLKVGNFQMSTSGNKSTITLGFAGPFDEAIKAVDFGKVTKTDQATRTINIELP